MSLLPEISQASAEINKLVAQANIHQTIARVDPAAFTDPADTMLLASRDPVIREVSVGMTGEAYSDYSVSGTPPLSLPNSLGKPLKAWSVDLLPYQEGTGDPSPDNVRPIHGTDKLTITTAGKNLCNAANNIVITNAGNIGSQPCAIPAGTYVYSATSSNTAAYLLTVFDANGVQIVSISSPKSYQGRSSLSFTITRNAAYIRCYYNASTSVSDIQVEAGSTATPYTPYIAPSSSVLTLPSTVYTGTIGSEGGESRWGEYVFDGSADENWVLQSINEHGIANFYYTITPYKPSVTPNGICNMFTQQTRSIASTTTEGWMLAAGTYLYIRVSADKANTSSQFKTWLASNNLQFVYELATTTTFSVPSPTIPTPTGTATTWATAEDGTVESMEVTYYKSE